MILLSATVSPHFVLGHVELLAPAELPVSGNKFKKFEYVNSMNNFTINLISIYNRHICHNMLISVSGVLIRRS